VSFRYGSVIIDFFRDTVPAMLSIMKYCKTLLEPISVYLIELYGDYKEHNTFCNFSVRF